ncbi:MAG: 3'-5' exonuclease [Solobacterium sp.]|nr:3'-5' exonuclease [Solobacterium sp.]
MKVVSIDFETANQNYASICAIGMCSLEDGCIEESYSTLIKPEREVGYFLGINTSIHGIRKEDVENAPSFSEIYDQLIELTKDSIVVAHNAPFDMSCLRQVCELIGLEIPNIRYVDTVTLSRKAFPLLYNHKLNTVSDYLEISLNHHDALSDANACLEIVAKVMAMKQIYDMEELCKTLNIKIHNLKGWK